MPPAHSPTIRARRLGRELRKLRESFGLELGEVAQRTAVSYQTLRRIEKGLHQTDISNLERLFEEYHVDFEKREELLELAANAFKRGWWLEYSDVLDDLFAALEDEADWILSYQSQVVPGLLQTDAYARALFQTGVASPSAIEAENVEKRVRARRERRAILERPDPPHLHAVLSEAVLRQEVGGGEVMARQLTYLAEMATRDTVTLQVLPYSAGAHAGMTSPFVIFEFADEADPDIAHTENLSGSAYSESQSSLARFRVAWGSVTDAALTPDESVAMLAALVSER
jgi:transcriptional regulator with XRE-family HTH domain